MDERGRTKQLDVCIQQYGHHTESESSPSQSHRLWFSLLAQGIDLLTKLEMKIILYDEQDYC